MIFYEEQARRFQIAYNLEDGEVSRFLLDPSEVRLSIPNGRFVGRPITDQEWEQVEQVSGNFRDAYLNNLGFQLSRDPTVRSEEILLYSKTRAYHSLSGVKQKAVLAALSHAFEDVHFEPTKRHSRKPIILSVPIGGQPRKR